MYCTIGPPIILSLEEES